MFAGLSLGMTGCSLMPEGEVCDDDVTHIADIATTLPDCGNVGM
jgi:hypothetical protein